MATLRVWQPHVLVSDVSLPDVDGYALIRQVRALDRLAGGDIPAVALTGRGRREDRIRLLSAGFQIHLVKPVDLTELVQTIASLAAYAAPGADAVIAAPVPSADATAETPDATSTDTSVGHELRQPLFAMGLWLNLLESEIGETQTAEARAHVAQLRASIAAMEDIVRRRLDEKS
jgi:CheY-like chemotaxis protein